MSRRKSSGFFDVFPSLLSLFCKVIEILHERAGKERDVDARHFIDLADRVGEFTLRFLDPLKYEPPYIRKAFSSHQETDVILDTAIKLQQKKVNFEMLLVVHAVNLNFAPYFHFQDKVWAIALLIYEDIFYIMTIVITLLKLRQFP